MNDVQLMKRKMRHIDELIKQLDRQLTDLKDQRKQLEDMMRA